MNHASVGFVPDAKVLELAIRRSAGAQHLTEVPPVHTDLMDGTVDGVLGK
jgi:hypothetical protein